MSTCSHIEPLLEDYLDGALSREERQVVERHLHGCATCRASFDALRLLQAETTALPRRVAPPHDLWPTIEARLTERAREVDAPGLPIGRNGQADRPPRRSAMRRRPARWLVAVLAVLLVSLGAWWGTRVLFAPSWEIAVLEGVPRVGAGLLEDTGRLRRGEWVETDATSSARLEVGMIGNVEVGPNTRLQLLQARPSEHRLALTSGTIHAQIWAPPRLFFVETPSALAIDLGCEYTLSVDSTGAGLLHVTSGYVALEQGERATIVPAGARAVTRPGYGPGTPFDESATPALQRALTAFDFEGGGTEALDLVLAEAHPDDAITLWDLLYRVPAAQQVRVYERLAALVPAPSGVTREGMLREDAAMVHAWRTYLRLDVENWWEF